MRTNRWQPSPWLTGRFDVALSSGLAVLAVLAALSRGDWRAVPLDLAACAAAALTVRWPRAAGVALALILVALLFMPPGWPSLGEYAPLIPLLGTGMRGERRVRLLMTIGYGALLAARSYTIAGSPAMWPLAVLVWAVIIGLLWAIGNLFVTYRAALEQAGAATLRQQRIALARDLHDTVARDLTRASLQGQSALAAQPSPQLESAVDAVQQASRHLRWMLALLREPEPDKQDGSAGTAAALVAEAVESLRRRGILIRSIIEGDLDAVPQALLPTVRAVLGEACANMERHAAPGTPCTIMMNVDDERLDAAFINQVRGGDPTAGHRLGLQGMRERLMLVGGDMVTEQEGTLWICRVSLPLR